MRIDLNSLKAAGWFVHIDEDGVLHIEGKSPFDLPSLDEVGRDLRAHDIDRATIETIRERIYGMCHEEIILSAIRENMI